MKVVVVGANGQIGRQLVALLGATEHRVRAMVRDSAQAPSLERQGVEVVVADLERDVSEALEGCDAVVFTAGSGGHTGGDKTLLVDLWGAVRTLRTAEGLGVRRFIMVSAIRAADPDEGREAIRHYLVAKHVADDYLRRSSLDYCIIRPGRLTNDDATGRIAAGTDIGYGTIPRGDVARTIVAALDHPNARRKTFCILAGDVPIEEALSGLDG